jgi:cysteine synthase A
MSHPKSPIPGPVRRDGVLNPTNYRVTAERIANEKGGVYTNQFDNVANFLAHYNGTGPEIYRQTRGKVDAFVCASGTGGTISGVSNFLKDTNPAIKIFLADCDGSALATKVLTGKLEMFGTGSFAEGIGNSMITGNHGRAVIDDAVRVRYRQKIVIYSVLYELNCLQGSCMFLLQRQGTS